VYPTQTYTEHTSKVLLISDVELLVRSVTLHLSLSKLSAVYSHSLNLKALLCGAPECEYWSTRVLAVATSYRDAVTADSTTTDSTAAAAAATLKCDVC
jgi:hypothetical protein